MAVILGGFFKANVQEETDVTDLSVVDKDTVVGFQGLVANVGPVVAEGFLMQEAEIGPGRTVTIVRATEEGAVYGSPLLEGTQICIVAWQVFDTCTLTTACAVEGNVEAANDVVLEEGTYVHVPAGRGFGIEMPVGTELLVLAMQVDEVAGVNYTAVDPGMLGLEPNPAFAEG